MESIFIVIISTWIVGMSGYAILHKFKNYNTVQFFDVSDKIRKYKKADEKTSIKK